MDERDELEAAVTESLMVMAEMMANPKPITARLTQGWVLVMRQAGVTPAEVRAASVKILSGQTFFPTPADFLKCVRPPEDRDATEELAWQRTLEAVRRYGGYASLTDADLEGDGVALWTISRLRWERLCGELTEENRAIIRAEFVRTYRLGAKHDARLAYLEGRQERENLALGMDRTRALCGRPDWAELPMPSVETPTLPIDIPDLPPAAAAALVAQVGLVLRQMPEGDLD